MNYRGAEEPRAACQLMLDEQRWAGGHFFYQFVKFFRRRRIKNHLCSSLTSRGQTCFFWGGEASTLFASGSCVKCSRRILVQHPGAVPSASDVARALSLTRLARVRRARAESALDARVSSVTCGRLDELGIVVFYESVVDV